MVYIYIEMYRESIGYGVYSAWCMVYGSFEESGAQQ